MSDPIPSAHVGLLLSGGLDSCILLGELLRSGRRVQPIFVRAGLAWENEERHACDQFLQAMARPELLPLVQLEQPVRDLYGQHWSTTGANVPDADTPDEAVFLPGRNALLLVKAALWCQLHEIPALALAPLASNPFPDARDEFFTAFEQALTLAMNRPLQVLRPFAHLSKVEVMRLGRDLPLELSFSCIAPRQGRHCGVCNKCGERRAAFRDAGLTDLTPYAHSP